MLLHEERRHLMVKTQIRTNKVTDSGVLAAFEDVPKEFFIDESLADLAYIDEDLLLANGRFILEPMVLARMIQALGLKESDSVLDIGSASGYSTALLAQLAGSVVGIESDEALALSGQNNLMAYGVDNAVILEGGLAAGYASEAPYNAIMVEGSAAAIPKDLLAQLADDGRLVAVLRDTPQAPGRAVKYTRVEGEDYHCQTLFDAQTPMLAAFSKIKGFSF